MSVLYVYFSSTYKYMNGVFFFEKEYMNDIKS